ncbi:unnamed protein product [Mytilus coruscus]|uniref:Uncharacterized protein n=1 Tax=Mytilus coruscus TaxID=42192 RepID=A0A6J8EKI8_MYTCO|nr:unnamed protein product [Mytilus coruscus]
MAFKKYKKDSSLILSDVLFQENEGSTDDLRKGLNRIVPHDSGDHSLCTDMEWCTYKDDPVNFKYKSLHGRKCLSNDALNSELRELVQQYNRRAESLQNMGSTQANENFNQIFESKCPKARSYGGSSSFNSRLSAAVLQKNGYTWLSMRRIENKKNRKKAHHSSSVKDGTTYEQETEVNDNACDIQQIPFPLTLSNSDQYIVFDLEKQVFPEIVTSLSWQLSVDQTYSRDISCQDVIFQMKLAK